MYAPVVSSGKGKFVELAIFPNVEIEINPCVDLDLAIEKNLSVTGLNFDVIYAAVDFESAVDRVSLYVAKSTADLGLMLDKFDVKLINLVIPLEPSLNDDIADVISSLVDSILDITDLNIKNSVGDLDAPLYMAVVNMVNSSSELEAAIFMPVVNVTNSSGDVEVSLDIFVVNVVNSVFNIEVLVDMPNETLVISVGEFEVAMGLTDTRGVNSVYHSVVCVEMHFGIVMKYFLTGRLAVRVSDLNVINSRVEFDDSLEMSNFKGIVGGNMLNSDVKFDIAVEMADKNVVNSALELGHAIEAIDVKVVNSVAILELVACQLDEESKIC
ncbi:hypothetical protein CHS0354_003840 [Potamilus streckersoni]|uniref:Uncharacterized protein n=1 Tax=Potamilus streckersoni TaxID=2493646 RepID=A0AAE0VW38_9BIVA|nr:hypothetical protein CHS0354_003840 [Potamilus streckersoni]